jgi:hypothetical protein
VLNNLSNRVLKFMLKKNQKLQKKMMITNQLNLLTPKRKFKLLKKSKRSLKLTRLRDLEH